MGSGDLTVNRYVALLRGINVGGRRKLAMPELRDIASQAGFSDVATYVQSGNVVLDSPLGADAVAGALGFAIEAATGVDVDVVVRSAGQWRDVVASNPFPAEAADGTKLHVTFLAGAPDGARPPDLSGVDASAFAPEEYAVVGREVYMSLPGGIGRSKLAAALERAASGSTVTTTRNWNTVLALAEMVAGPGT